MSLLLLFHGTEGASTAVSSGRLLYLTNRPVVGGVVYVRPDVPVGTFLKVNNQIVSCDEQSITTDDSGNFSIATPPHNTFTPSGVNLALRGPYDFGVRVAIASGEDSMAEQYAGALAGTAAATCIISGIVTTVKGGTPTALAYSFYLDAPLGAVIVTTDKSFVVNRAITVPVNADGTFSVSLLTAASLVPSGLKMVVQGTDGIKRRFTVPSQASVDLSTLL